MNTEPQTSIEEAREDLRDAVEEVIEGADNLAVAQVHAETQLAETVAAVAVVEAQLETAITKTELEEAQEQLSWERNRRVELEGEVNRLSLSCEAMTRQITELSEQVILLTSQNLEPSAEVIAEAITEVAEEIQPPTPPPHTDTPQTDDQQKSEAVSPAPALVEEVQEALSVPLITFI